MSYLVNGVDISNILITDASAANTSISSYSIQGNDIYKKFKQKNNLAFGLKYTIFGYAYQGIDISTYFEQKIINSATATYDLSYVTNGVIIKVTGSGDISFNFNLSRLSFAIIGAGGAGGANYGRNAGAGGGAGELIYGTYNGNSNLINSISVKIGLGSSGADGEYSSIRSNSGYLDVSANGGGRGGAGGNAGLAGGSSGGSGGGAGAPATKTLHSYANYIELGNNGGSGGSANDQRAGGGGGGAGGGGDAGNSYANGGNGGVGFEVSFNTIILPKIGGGGGGGGGGQSGVLGGEGSDGGGDGGGIGAAGVSGTANTGGGGGGTGYNGGGSSRSGGSGVLYLYIHNSYIYRNINTGISDVFTGSYLTTTQTYQNVTYNVLTFTDNGTFTFNSNYIVYYFLIVGSGGLSWRAGGGGGTVGINKQSFNFDINKTYTVIIGNKNVSGNDGITKIQLNNNNVIIANPGSDGAEYDGGNSGGTENTQLINYSTAYAGTSLGIFFGTGYTQYAAFGGAGAGSGGIGQTGGNGVLFNVDGITYGGGGGGRTGITTAINIGRDGGGNGGYNSNNATDASANRGGGAGGPGKKCGSGIVKIYYL